MNQNLPECVSRAYEKSLKKYHGWFLQKMFGVSLFCSMKMAKNMYNMPVLPDLLSLRNPVQSICMLLIDSNIGNSSFVIKLMTKDKR